MSFYYLPRERHASPSWSNEIVDVIDAASADELSTQIGLMLGDPDMNVLAFSEGTFGIVGRNGKNCEAWSSTVIFQERRDPNGTEAEEIGGVG